MYGKYAIIPVMKPIRNFIVKNPIWSSVIVVSMVIGSVFILYRSNTTTLKTIPVQRMDLVKSVSVSGRVLPASVSDLAFERSGRVAQVFAQVGDEVKKGDILVQLESADLFAGLSQAQAQLQQEELTLAERRIGFRTEEIAITQSTAHTAQTKYAQALESMRATLKESYSAADSAVRYRADTFFERGRYPDPKFTLRYQANDSSLSDRIEDEREQLEQVLSQWLRRLPQTPSETAIATDVIDVRITLNKIKSFLDQISLVVNNLLPDIFLTEADISSYKATLESARATVNTAITTLNTQEDQFNLALGAYTTAQNELTLKKAGYSTTEIATQQSRVDEFRSVVALKQADIARNRIVAPFDGIISRQDAKVGQIAPAGISVVSLLSATVFEIQAHIPEADISKISVGDSAHITLDAYGPKTIFEAVVTQIYPAEEMIDGIPTYKTSLRFTNADERIRSGMTASVEIIADIRTGVLAVPIQALQTTETGDSSVMVSTGAEQVQRAITPGLRASNGFVEIISGLQEGEFVLEK